MTSQSNPYPAQGISVVRVEGWPGKIRRAEHVDPEGMIVASTETATTLELSRMGLSTLRLAAFDDHAPDSQLILTVSVPQGTDIGILPHNQLVKE